MQSNPDIINSKVPFNIDPISINMLRQHQIVVVVPAYNEERLIGSVVLKLLKFPITVIVIDDGSSDATSLVAEAAGAFVIRHDQNLGKGGALNTGIREARRMNPDAIVVIDGDGQHLVRELPRVVQPIIDGEADITIGSRYLKRMNYTPTHRKIGHWFFNKFTNLTSRVIVTDSQSGFRAFSPKAYNTDLFQSTNFTVESEMQFLAHEHSLRVVEVPITANYVDKPKRSAIQQGLIVLNGILHLVGQYRPLLFFGVPGLIVMLTGLTMGFIVIEIYRRLTQLAVGYAMISVLLTVVGMVLFSTGIILHSVRGLLSDMLRKNGNKN